MSAPDSTEVTEGNNGTNNETPPPTGVSESEVKAALPEEAGEARDSKAAAISQSGSGRLLLEPNKWEEFLAGESCFGYKTCSCCSCWLIFLFGWIWFMIFIVKVSADGEDVFNTDEESLKSDLKVKNYYAFQAAAKSLGEGCAKPEYDTQAKCEADDRCEWLTIKLGKGQTKDVCSTKAVCPAPAPKERESVAAIFMAVYSAEREDGSLLDDDLMQHITDYEKSMLSDVDGAVDKTGAAAPWTNYCMLTYPMGKDTGGQCMSASSPMNIFSVTADARKAVEKQVGEGFSYAGALSCLCGHEAGLCSVCNADGTLKGLLPGSMNLAVNAMGTSSMTITGWPEAVSKCLAAKTATSRRLSEADAEVLVNASDVLLGVSRRLGSPDVCDKGGMQVSVATLGYTLAPWCKTKPTCQWAGPQLSTLCSSTVYSHAIDSTSLVGATEKKEIIANLFGNDVRYTNYRKTHFDMGFDKKDAKAKYGRLLFFAGGIGGGDSDMDALTTDYISVRNGWYMKASQLEKEAEKASEGKLRIMLFAQPLVRTQFMSLLVQDMLLSIIALYVVWHYMWFQLESAFLATCGIFEIVFSIPVAFSFWTVILQQQITFLQTLTLYMILGIGADDVFVLYDAWQQSKTAGPGISDHWTSRFAWAYRRAFWAMCVTTSTTCGSFLIGAFSPLPSVQQFCIFAAVVVLVDFLFCITFFASAIVVYEKHFAGVALGCKMMNMKGEPCLPMLAVPSKEPGQCLGPGCCCGLARCICSKGGTCWTLYEKPQDPSQPLEPRRIEKFCAGPLFNFLAGPGGKVMMGFWTLCTIIGVIVCGVSLRTAEEAPPIGRQHIDMTRSLEILISEFPSFRQSKTFAAWGIHGEEPIESWGATHDKNIAQLSSNGARELTTKEGQKQLLQLCQAADAGEAGGVRCETRQCIIQGSPLKSECPRNEDVWRKYGVYAPDDILCSPGRYCFMEDFARYWASKEGGCSGKDQAACAAATGACLWDTNLCYSTKTEADYPGLETDTFLAELGGTGFKAYRETRETVLRSNGYGFHYELSTEMTGFQMTSDNKNIAFAFIGWNATYPMQNTAEQANEWYDKWQTFYDTSGKGLGGFQTAELYVFMVTQNEMVKGAVTGILLSMVVAFMVMLIATKNWIVALLGLLNIGCIVLVFLGLMTAVGWSLGEYECIFMIATVGLSVDYTAHLLHAYNHSHEATRAGRTRTAMAEMGISVLSSALTTLGAAAVLFGCGFYFFFQFGAFIFMIIMLSIGMSLTFLMPIMIAIGPEREAGRLFRNGKNLPDDAMQLDKE
eukprot:TRINITY_DN9252_c0_g1_i1.p1 TRINITY_DN9252_c0_g1~~TRINITY_DN9252_c0_g1_i1.p1  ORF type:complete len:1293 (-),score=312.13 TRINITY_DN9252_c0_g1_i1:899-4777(-)